MPEKIEKGIPLPAPRGKNGWVATLTIMKKGDSVLFKGADSASLRNTAAHVFGHGNYACRKEAEGFRVWRLA